MTVDGAVLHQPRPGWLLGPWPLAPLAAFVMTLPVTIIVAFRTEALAPAKSCVLACWTVPSVALPAFANSSQSYAIDPVAIFGYALALAGGSSLTLLAFRHRLRLDDLHAPSRRDYVLAIISAAFVGSAAGILALWLERRPINVAGFASNMLRLVVILVLVHWVSGRLTYGYAQEAARAKAALAEITRQRWLIVQADERVRREIADYLHDNVQAELLVSAMRLRAIEPALGAEPRAELDDVIDNIERIRQVGVRSTGQRLSPDVAHLGLYPTLTYLATTWAPAMTVTVDFSSEAQQRLVHPHVASEVPTALYRVVEQALLNAAAHGRARNEIGRAHV